MTEKEYKWRADEWLLGQALLWASSRMGSQSHTFHMRSQYYDTPDRLLRDHGAALRLRQENKRSVCCMKVRGGDEDSPSALRERAEYQCDASTIHEGLAELPDKGAPAELCELAAAAPLEVTCEVDFKRCSILMQDGNTVVELALDDGEMRRGERRAPLCEIELEFIVGEEAVFHRLADSLATQLSLVPEPLSKLARASAL